MHTQHPALSQLKQRERERILCCPHLVLCRPSTDYTRPTHVGDCDLSLVLLVYLVILLMGDFSPVVHNRAVSPPSLP